MSTADTQLGPQFESERLKPALEFIEAYWKKLERFSPHDDGTLIGLPRPYFIPSATNQTAFAFEEIYYWDTFFIAQGLIGTPRQYLLKDLAENLMSMMQRYHIIPTASRTYMTSRSQPPFLTTLIMQAYETDKNKRWLEQSMTVAKEEYRSVWMGTAHPNWRQVSHGLSRYYDINVLDDLAEAESGWDYTSRFHRQALSYLPVDLNALLYKYERDFEESCRILGYKDEAREWSKRSMARRSAMQNFMWNDDKGFYFDYNYMSSKQSDIYSLAGFFPAWAGMEDADSVSKMVKQLDKFEFGGGLSSTAKEPHYESRLPLQWAYPNGWAPLQLIVVEALERYNYHAAAERIARKWIEANLIKFEETGEFWEKYNVVDPDEEAIEGVYPSQPGFGWTNSVFVRLCYKYLRPEELPDIQVLVRQPPLKDLVRNPRQTLRRVGVKLNSALPKRQA